MNDTIRVALSVVVEAVAVIAVFTLGYLHARIQFSARVFSAWTARHEKMPIATRDEYEAWRASAIAYRHAWNAYLGVSLPWLPNSDEFRLPEEGPKSWDAMYVDHVLADAGARRDP
jgi:hypothetical protein